VVDDADPDHVTLNEDDGNTTALISRFLAGVYE
jgi:hypothetical protein